MKYTSIQSKSTKWYVFFIYIISHSEKREKNVGWCFQKTKNMACIKTVHNEM